MNSCVLINFAQMHCSGCTELGVGEDLKGAKEECRTNYGVQQNES